jgi:sterol desaturase/sphingolipid hydroxylase (fatty acid hydroxylase superfamily)
MVLFPACVAAFTAFALAGATLDVATPLGVTPERARLLVMAIAVVGFYTIIATLEAVRPHRLEWRRPRGDLRTDALHLALTGPLASGLYEGVGRGLAIAGGGWLTARLGGAVLWPSAWPLVGQLFLAIAVAELGHWAFHRLCHEHPVVWRVHAVHHSAERLYWLNATRFHPLDLFTLIVCQSTPLFLLGIPERTYFAYTLFAIVYGQLQHANVEIPTPRRLDRIFATPGVHRWHHSVDPREGNANYGAILSVWDTLFGTLVRPADRSFAGPVGLRDLPRFPRTWLEHLRTPFVRWTTFG